jgi:hypothetical protein
MIFVGLPTAAQSAAISGGVKCKRSSNVSENAALGVGFQFPMFAWVDDHGRLFAAELSGKDLYEQAGNNLSRAGIGSRAWQRRCNVP